MPTIERIGAVRSRVKCDHGMEALLFADREVAIDRSSLQELDRFAQIRTTVARLSEDRRLGIEGARITDVVLMPDFHKGSAMPVGTACRTEGIVFPQAVGGDIGCGMSLAVLDVAADEVRRMGRDLDSALRHAFFEGGRDIRLSRDTMEAILSDGIGGLARVPAQGLPESLGQDGIADVLGRMHRHGMAAGTGGAAGDWLRMPRGAEPVRDAFLGTIGGGNHFVELQEVSSLLHRTSAWHWGLRPGAAAIMVHSGSLSIGKAVALLHCARAEQGWPDGLSRPDNGFMPLPLIGEHARLGRDYLADMAAAANFAAVNRLCLSLMARQAVSRTLGREVGWRFVHDLPHNLVWTDGTAAIHRKGACPSVREDGHPVFPSGHPVLVPGSMGTASYVLKAGQATDSLGSAPHGAGRALSRNAGRASADCGDMRIVTKVDLRTARGPVREALEKGLSEEAPRVYKDIETVAATVEAADIATKVARLTPILTVKG